jgi:hypothetical protein
LTTVSTAENDESIERRALFTRIRVNANLFARTIRGEALPARTNLIHQVRKTAEDRPTLRRNAIFTRNVGLVGPPRACVSLDLLGKPLTTPRSPPDRETLVLLFHNGHYIKFACAEDRRDWIRGSCAPAQSFLR